jgi:phenylalanyl-tRNA synthetase beta chain
MIVSLKLMSQCLNELFNYKNEKIVEETCALLTSQGFEVESTTWVGRGLESVVVGKILEAQKHPQADKLQVCQVSVGASQPLQIVCGAPNARAGLFVAVALVDSKLPPSKKQNSTENFLIKESKIRDVLSQGMLCSREELGLNVNSETDGVGIWEIENIFQGGTSFNILEKNLGQPVLRVLDIEDVVLDIAVTPNRPDMLSHVGVAREIAAGSRLKKNIFAESFTLVKNLLHALLEKNNSENNFVTKHQEAVFSQKMAISNTISFADQTHFKAEQNIQSHCYFIGIENITVSHSPAWIRNTLENLGQPSINSVVDVSNYFLALFGQPSHAFDFQKLTGSSKDKNFKTLFLRQANEGEKFIGLDSKERTLHASDCVVADANIPQALLGVIGGDLSKVELKSKQIILEFANPNPVAVRRTSRRHGRRTDSSFAFEKGIDLQLRKSIGFEMAVFLLALHKDAAFCGSCLAATLPKNVQALSALELPSQREIVFKSSSLEKIVGLQSDGSELVPFQEQINILKSLQFEVFGSAGEVVVKVPSWRMLDVMGVPDLAEEIVRLVGIDKIPLIPLPAGQIPLPDDAHLTSFESVAVRATSLGYSEIASYHFMSKEQLQKLRVEPICLGVPVEVLNPIMQNLPFMQQTLIPNLLERVSFNESRGNFQGKLFHIARSYQGVDVFGKPVFEEKNLNISAEKNISGYFEYQSIHAFRYSLEESQEKRPAETPRIAFVAFGPKESKNWTNKEEIYWNTVEFSQTIFESLKPLGCALSLIQLPSEHPFAKSVHPGKCAAIQEINSKLIVGWVGAFHPAVLKEYNISNETFGCEVNLALCLKPSSQLKAKAVPTQRFQSVQRDFSFLVSEETTAGDVQKASLKALAPLLEKLGARQKHFQVFDVFRGVEKGKKTLAVRYVWEPLQGTFKEEQINSLSLALVQEVKQSCFAELRES